MLVSNGHAFGPGFSLGLTSKAPRFCRAWPSSTGRDPKAWSFEQHYFYVDEINQAKALFTRCLQYDVTYQ